MKKLHCVGIDGWDRPVYQDETGNYWKDINCGRGLPYLHDTDGFGGEPGWPVEGDYEITANTPEPKKTIAEQMQEGATQAAKENAARSAPPKKTDKDRG